MKDVLIVVDMQNDFVTGALGSAEAVAALPGVVERARRALADGERLIFTLDTHGADYLSTHEGKQLPVVHCVRGEPGWELAPGLKELSAAAELIEKPAFGSTELAHRLASEAAAAGLDSGRGLTIEAVRRVHRHMRGIQRADAARGAARGRVARARGAVRGRHTGAPCGRAGGHARLPNRRHLGFVNRLRPMAAASANL